MMQLKQSKYIRRILFTTALTILIFFIIFTNVDIQKTIAVIKNANLVLISIALIISLCTNILICSYVWKEILKQLNYNISYRESVIITASTIPVLNLIPLKLGHFAKCAYLKKYNAVPVKISALSVTVHLVVATSMLVFILAVASLFIMSPSSQLLYITILSLLIILLKKRSTRHFIANTLKKSSQMNKIYLKISEAITFRPKNRYRDILKITIYCLTNKLLVITNYYILFISLGIHIPLIEYAFLISATIILSHLPLTISGIGAREGLILLFFSGFGSPESLLSAGLLISAIDYIFPALIGIFFLNISPRMLEVYSRFSDSQKTD